ncbi:MAG: hypothetical protein ACRBG0_27795 [Lewinella sp.]|uniref:hypothetical protein n=1 Tax=Lewinella sp. TaxID=2004506 RepID=UPI003D6AA7C1
MDDTLHVLPTNDIVDCYDESHEQYDKESGHTKTDYCICKPEIINGRESFKNYINRQKGEGNGIF